MPAVHYNQIPQKIVKDQAKFIFKELSNGIYETLKYKSYKLDKFVGSSTIVSLLNKNEKVYVIGINGTYYNFEIEGFGSCFNGDVK